MTDLSYLGAFGQFLAPYPFWVKCAVFAALLSSFVSLLGLIFAAPLKKPEAAGDATTITHNITSIGQAGGITAHTVNNDKETTL